MLKIRLTAAVAIALLSAAHHCNGQGVTPTAPAVQHASGAVPAPAVAQAAAPTADTMTRLVGKWTSTGQSPAGQEILTAVNFQADASFTGQATVGGRVFFSFSGIWSIQDNVLTWHYLETSPAIPEESRIVADAIVSSDSGTLVLLSKQSGKQRIFNRAP